MTATPVIAGLAGFAVIGILILIGLFILAAILLWAARIVGIENRSFGKAIGTIFIGGIASTILTAMLSAAPIVGTGAGILIGFCISSVVMMGFFNTTFGKALGANIIAWVLGIVVMAMAFAFLAAFLAAGAA
jgi:hypothetical protein